MSKTTKKEHNLLTTIDIKDDWYILIYDDDWELENSYINWRYTASGRIDKRYNSDFICNNYSKSKVYEIVDFYRVMRNDFLLLKNQTQKAEERVKEYTEDVRMEYSRDSCFYVIDDICESEFLEDGELEVNELFSKFVYAKEHGDGIAEKIRNRKSLDTSGTKK